MQRVSSSRGSGITSWLQLQHSNVYEVRELHCNKGRWMQSRLLHWQWQEKLVQFFGAAWAGNVVPSG
jgi:hypothetical protein